MSRIQYLSPSDPGIISIAKMFNVEHRRISLLQTIESARSGNIKAHDLLNNERLLQIGISRIPRQLLSEKRDTAVHDFYYAVALAQRRLRREDKEVLYLKFLVKSNYTKDRQRTVFDKFTDIANLLAENNLEQEKYFYNYVVDKLISISQLKKSDHDMRETLELDKSGFNDEAIEIGEIDTEVQSEANGFKLDTDLTDRLCGLFFEAASTPWHTKSSLK